MDAETAAAIKQLADRVDSAVEHMALRVRWLAERHEAEWKDAATWRSQWGAELDAIELQVDLLVIELQRLRAQLESPNDADAQRTAGR
jgi:hypothetical protein